MSTVEIRSRDADGVEGILRRGGDGLRERMARAEAHLDALTAGAGAPLARHANATIRAGGKRLRPLLVVLAAESAGGPPEGEEGEMHLIRAAVAVELVHSATLVHDDLIDGAALRRGRPTVASAGGRKAAVATGDLLFSLALRAGSNSSPYCHSTGFDCALASQPRTNPKRAIFALPRKSQSA